MKKITDRIDPKQFDSIADFIAATERYRLTCIILIDFVKSISERDSDESGDNLLHEYRRDKFRANKLLKDMGEIE